jgi:hypothetical protein
VTRSIAGAASRVGPVVVLAAGPAGTVQADGAFDLIGMGEGGSVEWPADMPSGATLIVDELSPGVTAIAGGGLTVSAPSGGVAPGTWRKIGIVDGDGEGPIGLFVPVNPLAMRHRHHGFGFTGYALVLSDRGVPAPEPPNAAAWLTAAFDDLYVVVVEGAVASAWKGRALRGATSVDTRMDLWRLMAHAAVCVDLAPGSFVARECVESLRLGTPVIVPAESPVAALHARASGGMVFSDAWELTEAMGKFSNEANRAAAAILGREYADAWFGEAAPVVARIGDLLAQASR